MNFTLTEGTTPSANAGGLVRCEARALQTSWFLDPHGSCVHSRSTTDEDATGVQIVYLLEAYPDVGRTMAKR